MPIVGPFPRKSDIIGLGCESFKHPLGHSNMQARLRTTGPHLILIPPPPKQESVCVIVASDGLGSSTDQVQVPASPDTPGENYFSFLSLNSIKKLMEVNKTYYFAKYKD